MGCLALKTREISIKPIGNVYFVDSAVDSPECTSMMDHILSPAILRYIIPYTTASVLHPTRCDPPSCASTGSSPSTRRPLRLARCH